MIDEGAESLHVGAGKDVGRRKTCPRRRRHDGERQRQQRGPDGVRGARDRACSRFDGHVRLPHIVRTYSRR